MTIAPLAGGVIKKHRKMEVRGTEPAKRSLECWLYQHFMGNLAGEELGTV